jgi:MFS family permease
MPSQNWPTWKKNMTLAIISLASMAGTLQGLANSSGLFQQAENYHKTAIQITYSLAASNAGLAVGPLFWTPLALRFGRCAAIFWGTLLTLLFNVWGARCTGESDYISFTLSRLFASIAGSCATTSSSPFSFCIFRLLPCTENSSRPN